ncbi:hypothetical protein B0T25DRAFT_571217 [Lasiosphaeria hispida]|uniref:Cyanovirin-N domain-containing protein n=1 Tax=Lasiosphaeria hispida TaxID=260671 RepID=A0AAJ0MAP0_9PEZI|nr:hypothetical protein B0T25DRAFT_571217 [Lasiosphaeria hispida]
MKLAIFSGALIAVSALASPAPVPRVAVDSSPADRFQRHALTKRATFDGLNCQKVRGEGLFGVIVTGIQQLLLKSGRPSSGPGRAACNLVFCEQGSAIWWCNDNPYSYSLSSYSEIADGAIRIVTSQQCTQASLDRGGAEQRLSGQVFYKEGFNVIVGSC